MPNLMIVDFSFVVLILLVGLYTLIAAKNMIRILLGYEIMAKGVTLALATAGSVNGRIQFSQSLIITFIVVEVVFIAIALGVVMLAHKNNQSMDVRKLTNLKG